MSRRYVPSREKPWLRLIRGHGGLSKVETDKLLNSLNSITSRVITPYEIVKIEAIKKPGREQDSLYVLTFYFIDFDEYDIGIYVPKQRFEGCRKCVCWQRASNLVHDEKRRLEREGESFSFSTYVRPFVGIPSPLVEGLTFSRHNWSSMIDLVWKVKRAQEKYSQ